MGKSLEMTRRPETSNVECKQSPISENELKNRGSVYMTENYAHRRNADGSFDTICLHCFRTVASSPTGAALAESETEHRCPARDLQIFQQSGPGVGRPSSI
jgi:hypothetical protein